MEKVSVFVVEDDRDVSRLVRHHLISLFNLSTSVSTGCRPEAITTTTANNVRKAVKKIKTLPPKTRLGANGNAFIGGYRLWSVKLRYGKQRFH